jgi:lysophospholipase L1-like esterase
MGMKRIKLLFLSSLIFLILIIFIFGCLELTFRYLDRRGVTELPYHVANGTYMPLKMKSHYQGRIAGIPVIMNRDGLRDEPDFDPTPPANEYRILSMGDSIAFGLGIKSSGSYAKVLERKLNEGNSPPHYYVINAAGPGYSPSSYYLFLKNDGLQWHPRMVVLEIELCNDVTDEALMRWEVDPSHPGRPRAIKGGRYLVAWDGIMLSAYTRGPYFYEKTYTYVELSRRFFDLLNRLFPTEPFHSDPSITYYILGYDKYLLDQKRLEDGWTRMFAALQATNDLLHQQGSSFLLMIMPSRYMFDGASDSKRAGFARGLVNRAVALAKQKGIPCMDFTETIGAAGGNKVFLDAFHLNEEGNLAVGTALYDQLKVHLATGGKKEYIQ